MRTQNPNYICFTIWHFHKRVGEDYAEKIGEYGGWREEEVGREGGVGGAGGVVVVEEDKKCAWGLWELGDGISFWRSQGNV